MTKRLDHLAERLEGDPYFLACLLRSYATSEGLSDAELAVALGCTVDTLKQAGLCRAPKESSFTRDVDVIAQRFGLQRAVLVEAVRRGQVLERLRGNQGRAAGTFMAARDGTPATEEEP